MNNIQWIEVIKLSQVGKTETQQKMHNHCWENVQEECIPVGCKAAEHWPYSRVCCFPGGVSAPGGVCSRGGWSGTPPRTRQVPPLWTEWMTDRCKNITLAKTSFRPVNISKAPMNACDIVRATPVAINYSQVFADIWHMCKYFLKVRNYICVWGGVEKNVTNKKYQN